VVCEDASMAYIISLFVVVILGIKHVSMEGKNIIIIILVWLTVIRMV
jgi:hypothetical protein